MTTQQIVFASKGNPGAAMAFMDLIQHGKHEVAQKIMELGIAGTDVYVLFSDLCGKDVYRVERLVKNCPVDILKDACGRQDFSGRELIKEFI